MPRTLEKSREAARNPLAFAARRWTPHPRTVQRAAFAALVMSVLIVVTGGAVRLTGSGLGCDTWPKCTDESLFTTPEMGLHGLIEFGNRMLTYVVSAAVGWTIIAARCALPRRQALTRLAWGQFWVVLGNAVIGGVTVLTGLNPFTVAAHFLLAMTLITVTLTTWQRTREGDAPPRLLVEAPVRRAVLALTVMGGALLLAGTAVTGSGRHAGDDGDIVRMSFDWESVTRVHSVLAWIVVLGTLVIWVMLRRGDAPPKPRARVRDLFLVLLAQGGIGYLQYYLDEPEILVGIHLFGAVLVWIATLRLLLSLRDRGPAPKPAAAPGQGVVGPVKPIPAPGASAARTPRADSPSR